MDDDEQVLGMLRAMLEEKVCRVLVASDGNEGLTQLRETVCNLVITDIVMPEKDGTAVCMEIKREFPQTKVIAMSGAPGATGYLSIAQELGATSILRKPFSNKDLLLAMGQALDLPTQFPRERLH